MAALQINPSKNKTIARLVVEKFPALKRAGVSVAAEFISIRTVAYILALIIDSISIPTEDSINTRALQHESALQHEYSKMKPEKFTNCCRPSCPHITRTSR
jgi:hypothetical protein